MVTDRKIAIVLDLIVAFHDLAQTRHKNKYTLLDYHTNKSDPRRARPMDNAALKRKSMELTRVLAELRRQTDMLDEEYTPQEYELDEHPDEEDGSYCPACAGSGEGMHEGTVCGVCGGHGE